jgi:hypothetical protein
MSPVPVERDGTRDCSDSTDRDRDEATDALRRELDVGLMELDRGRGIPAAEVFRRLEEKDGRPG